MLTCRGLGADRPQDHSQYEPVHCSIYEGLVSPAIFCCEPATARGRDE